MIRYFILVAFLSIYIVSIEAATFTSNTLIDSMDTSFAGEDIVVNGCTVIINGQHTFNSVQIRNGSTITHTPKTPGGLTLTVTGDLIIDAGGKIDVTDCGYGPNEGPGVGELLASGACGGSGYGGMGGICSDAAL